MGWQPGQFSPWSIDHIKSIDRKDQRVRTALALLLWGHVSTIQTEIVTGFKMAGPGLREQGRRRAGRPAFSACGWDTW